MLERTFRRRVMWLKVRNEEYVGGALSILGASLSRSRDRWKIVILSNWSPYRLLGIRNVDIASNNLLKLLSTVDVRCGLYLYYDGYQYQSHPRECVYTVVLTHIVDWTEFNMRVDMAPSLTRNEELHQFLYCYRYKFNWQNRCCIYKTQMILQTNVMTSLMQCK